jgi:predicted RNA-binding Zn ribbon-like protein
MSTSAAPGELELVRDFVNTYEVEEDADLLATPAAALNRAAARAHLQVRFASEGSAAAASLAPGVDGALGRLLGLIATAMADGTWSRLKACRAEDCRWAFYDHARNHSRQWCSMAVCGNRRKARTYRRRHAA